MAARNDTERPPRRRPRRGRRIALAVLIVLVLLVAAAAFFGPAIAGPIAERQIERLAGENIAGEIEVSDLRLSWTGQQHVGRLALLDPRGDRVGDVQAVIPVSIIDLALGKRDLGEVTLRGAVDLRRDEGGRLNALEALRPVEDRPTQPLPEGLRLVLVVDDLDVTYVDHAPARSEGDQPTDGAEGRPARQLAVEDLNGRVVIDPARPLTADLRSARVAAPGVGDAGTLTVAAELRDWADAQRVPRLAQAHMEADFRAEQWPSDGVDALLDMEGRLARALGERFTLHTLASGAADDLNVQAQLRAPSASASIFGHLSTDTVSLRDPTEFSADLLDALAVAAPAAVAAFEEDVRFERRPTATIHVAAASLPLPAQGPVRVDRLEVDATARISPTSGILRTAADARSAIDLQETTIILAGSAGEGLHLRAQGAATLDGQDAGTLLADIHAQRLMDADGTFVFDPAALRGEATLRGVSTVLLQPFADDARLDLGEAVGPDISASLAFAPAGETAAEGAPDLAGQSRAQIRVVAQRASAEGELLISQQRIRSGAGPLAISWQSPGPALLALLPEDAPLRITSSGPLRAEVRNLDIPLAGEVMADRIAAASGELSAALRDLQARRPGDETPIVLSRGDLAVTLEAQQPARATLEADLARAEHGFSVAAQAAIASLAGLLDPETPIARGLSGELTLTDVPTALALELGLLDAPEGEQAPPYDAILAQGVGPTVSIALTAAPEEDGRATAISARAEARLVTLEAAGRMDPQALAIESATARGTLTPALAALLVERYAPEAAGDLRLQGPTSYALAVDPFGLPLQEPRIPARVRAQFRANPLTLRQADPQGDDAPAWGGVVTLADLRAELAYTAAESPGEGGRGALRVVATTRALDEGEQLLGELRSDLQMALGADPAGLRGRVEALDTDTTLFDRLAGNPGLVSGALGGNVNVELAFQTQGQTQLAQVNVAAPRLRTAEPVSLAISPQQIELGALRATWRVDPAWATRLALDDGAIGLRFIEPMNLVLEADRTVIPRAAAAGGREESLEIELAARADRLSLESDEGTQEHYDRVRLALSADPATLESIRFGAAAQQSIEGADPVQALQLTGELEDFRDEWGEFDFSNATLTLRSEIRRAPVALIDGLLDQKGLLVDLIGPRAEAVLVADHLSRRSGILRARMQSDRAWVNIEGHVRDNVFVLNAPAAGALPQIRISQFTPDLTARISSVVPLVGRIEKRSEDDPATIRLDNLEIPLDGDYTRLNGRLRVALGSARFEASPLFSGVLKIAQQRQANVVARGIDPVDLAIDSGVVSYPRFQIPLGDFTIQTRGEVSIPERRLDVVTYVPFGALTDEAASMVKLNTGRIVGAIGGVVPSIERLTYVPIRTRGSIDDPSINVDVEAFVRETFTETLRPDRIIEQGVKDIMGALPLPGRRRGGDDGGG